MKICHGYITPESLINNMLGVVIHYNDRWLKLLKTQNTTKVFKGNESNDGVENYHSLYIK